MKSQVLANFVVELTEGKSLELPKIRKDDEWILHIDGLSNARGCGIGLVIVSPKKDVLERSIRLGFRASNNDTEYKALINSLKMAAELKIQELNVLFNSQLVVQQMKREFEAREEKMRVYLKITLELSSRFRSFTVEQIPREENAHVDSLAGLGSSSTLRSKRSIIFSCLESSSLALKENQEVKLINQDDEMIDVQNRD